MRGWCRIWDGPRRRTIRRLHGCEGALENVIGGMRVGGWHNLPFECFCETMLVAFDLEDLDRLIGGACC
jgi:hypothetical protein